MFFWVMGVSTAENLFAQVRAWPRVSRIAGAVDLMVPGDVSSSLMMLYFCVWHVLRHVVELLH